MFCADFIQISSVFQFSVLILFVLIWEWRLFDFDVSPEDLHRIEINWSFLVPSFHNLLKLIASSRNQLFNLLVMGGSSLLLLGWFALNRWAMFGFAVGLLTEYATGSNFVDQVKILLSNFGIVDLEWHHIQGPCCYIFPIAIVYISTSCNSSYSLHELILLMAI